MRFRYEGSQYLFDSYPSSDETIFVHSNEGSSNIYSLMKVQNYDRILPGPVWKVRSNQKNEVYYLNVDSKVFIHFKGRIHILRREERNLDYSGIVSNEIRSPMPGKILKLFKSEGDQFQIGDVLVILEAMKMENQLKASFSGRVGRLNCKEGNLVQQDSLLMELIIQDDL